MVKKIDPNRLQHTQGQGESPKLLMINYYFPPVRVVGALRVGHFYLQAKKYFSNIFVLTSKNERIYKKEEWKEVFPETVKIPAYDFRFFLHWYFGNNVLSFSYKKKKHPLKRWLIKLIDSFPLNILINDGGLIYQLLAYQRAKKIVEEEQITHIFSSFKPYADHIVAYWLKRRYPHLCWIADFRDVQVDPNRKNVIFPALQHWFNRRYLKDADVLTSVSEPYANYLSQYNDQVYCLRNGIANLDFSTDYSSSYPKFTIAYTGSIYPELQSGDNVFRAISNLINSGKIVKEHLQVKVAGRDQVVWEEWARPYGLESILNLVGSVNRAEALKIQRESHLNLLLSWSSKALGGVLTGKLYEYLSAQRPVIALIKGSRDNTFETLFKTVNAGLVCYHDSKNNASLEDFIYAKYVEWLTQGFIDHQMNRAALKDLTWSAQMERFFESLALAQLKPTYEIKEVE